MPLLRKSTLVTKRSSPTSWVVLPELVGEDFPAVPVVFGAAVFDGDDRIALLEIGVEVDEFVGGVHGPSDFLEDVGLLIPVEEFGRGDVEGEGDVLTDFVACGFDGLAENLHRVFRTLERGSESTFVTDGGGKTAVVEDFLERVEDFRAVADGLAEGRRADGHDHEFLEVDRCVGVGAAVDDVHHRDGKHLGVRTAEVFVERHSKLGGGGLGDGEGNAEDGIGTEVLLGGGAVEREHGRVDGGLFGGVET